MKLARNSHVESPSSTMAGPHFERHGMVGHSHAVGEVIRRVELVSASRSTVLITGETGTGKELVARAGHHRSAQRDMPFVKVNCAAIPEALLESELFGHVRAHSPTLPVRGEASSRWPTAAPSFLDEIGTMSVGLQASCCVLQEREIEPLGGERTEHVDVRVIAATNRDLQQLVGTGRFQDDLFYRLHVVPIVCRRFASAWRMFRCWLNTLRTSTQTLWQVHRFARRGSHGTTAGRITGRAMSVSSRTPLSEPSC